MDLETMLSSFAKLLETRVMGDDVVNDSEVVVTAAGALNGHLYLTLEGNDGTTKHFRLLEI